jgi:peroxiredoxin
VNDLKGGFLFLGVLALAMVGLAVWNASTPQPRPAGSDDVYPVRLRVGTSAPDFSAKTLDGQEKKLSDFRGQVVVLDFWFVQCPHCVAMMPHEKHMVEKYKGRPFAILGVNTDAYREEAASFAERKGLPWLNFWDADRSIARNYGVEYYPTLFILDGDGVIRYRDTTDQFYRDEDLERAVEKLLAEQEAKAPKG